MTDFRGLEIERFWNDLKLGMHHFRDCKRKAVVGDHRWLEWYTITINPLMKTEIHYFSPDQMNEAWTWAQSSIEKSSDTAKVDQTAEST